MDFSITAELAADAKRVEAFVADEIIPLEADPAHYDAYGNIDMAVLQSLRARVKAVGLWAPQIPKAQGGSGHRGDDAQPKCKRPRGQQAEGGPTEAARGGGKSKPLSKARQKGGGE